MSYQALARKYRPQTFRDIIGQPTIVRTLQNAIDQKRIHHAYLFSGVRGIGKTTSARIFAKALNCVKGPTTEPCNECSNCREITEGIDLDVREIDAATYTQVDNIRELREITQFQPARDLYRIFIIDEAHMLSSGAWNALLKLIEEPPPHVVFMMATTEIHKVPATILSRVQQFALRKITVPEVADRLEEICSAENIEAERAALEMVALRGEGSVRDSLSLLDQVVAFTGRAITMQDVNDVLGLSDDHFLNRLLTAVNDGDAAVVIDTLEEAAEGGRDFKLLFRDVLSHLRSMLFIRSGARAAESANTASGKQLHDLASRFEYTELLRILNLLLKDDELVSRSEYQRLAVEIAFLKATTLPRLRRVEEELKAGGSPKAGGGTTPPRQVATPSVAKRIASASAAPEVSTPPARERKQEKPVAPEVTTEQESVPRASTDDLEAQFVARVRTDRKLLASYLDQAAGVEFGSAAITINFDATNNFAYEYLANAEQQRYLEQIATQLTGNPMRVDVRKGPGSTPTSPKGSALEATVSQPADDPLLRAFARHLGGEIVAGSPGKSSED